MNPDLDAARAEWARKAQLFRDGYVNDQAVLDAQIAYYEELFGEVEIETLVDEVETDLLLNDGHRRFWEIIGDLK